MRLISVVMGEENQNDRTNETVAMLNYGKGSYKLNTILEKGKVMGKVFVELSDNLDEDVVTMEDAVDLINVNDTAVDYTYEVNIEPQVAPLKVGSRVGSVKIYFNGNETMEVGLTVKNDIEKCSIFKLFKRMLSLVILGSKN